MSGTTIGLVLVVAVLVGVAAYVIGLLVGQQRGAASATRSAGQLRDEMRALSAQAVSESSQRVLELADSRVHATEQVVAPVQQSLLRLNEQLGAMSQQNASWRAELKTQVESVRLSGSELRQQTQSLADALRRPQVRGHWGEMQLRRSLELAGVTSRCVFDEQVSRRTDDGALRPDVVVSLPGGKSVVIDSKVPLDAFLSAIDSATNPAARDAHLDRHARQVRAHIDALAAKSYWQQFAPSPEFVVMFVPGEAIFAQAIETDPVLIDYAAGKKVMLATPTTLIAMLKTVAYAWTQEALADNAREVSHLARELYDRIATMGGHIDRLGRALTSAVGGYNKMVGSIETRVLVSARKLRDLEVTDATIETPTSVTEVPKPMTAPELVADEPTPSVIEGAPGQERWARRAVGE
ncbi:MAG: DNA recombination protein RmuC [Nocardioidaceae bacterium]